MNAEHYDPEKLTDLRKNAGLTQEQVAVKVNKKRLTIVRAENGEAASYELLCDLAKLYHVPVVSLLYPIPKSAA